MSRPSPLSIPSEQPAGGDRSGPIAVYGATGFTGGLIAGELRDRGADLVLAGRNRAKLEPLSERLGGVPVAVAALDDPSALRELLEPCAAVVACAGPFTLHGEPLLAAAAKTGTHYLDTTGEQEFIALAFDRYGAAAEASGAALVPGMGFDYVPGDMLAALVAAGMGALEEIAIAYHVEGFAPTHGTALSALEIMRGGDVVWDGGGRRPAPRGASGGSWRFPEPVGERSTLRYPAGEQITVPRHVEAERVRTMLSGMAVPPSMTPLLVAVTPLLGLAMRAGPLRGATGALVRRLPSAPSEKQRKASRFVVSCEARAGDRVRRGAVRGADVYGLTAASLAHGAMLCAAPGFDRTGALAPAQAFDPASFLAAMAHFLSYELDPLPTA
jgi:short subunit dehydrogenase-like uncharacterized protein